MLGIGLSLTSLLRSSVADFSPASIFSSNEPGVWYDPSDLTTLFQDPAGTIPVTGPAQTVGLALDKSKGLVLGPELVTNGTFDTDVSGWASGVSAPTRSWVSGTMRIENTGVGFTNETAQQQINLTVGKTYRLTIECVSETAIDGFFTLSTLAGNKNTNNVFGVDQPLAAGQTSVRIFTAAFSTYYLHLLVSGNAGGAIVVDNISIRELPGNHATQATAASRPTYGVVPLGGRRNLLTRTEEFDNADWVKGTSSIPSTNNTAPNGTATADQFVTVGTANTIKPIYQTFSAAATTYTFSAYVKDNGGAARAIDLFFATTSLSAAVGTTYNFDTDTLTNLSSAAPFTFVSSSRTSVGSGWFRVSVAVTVASAQTIRLYITAPFAAAQVGNYLIWGAQLETGSSATAYQRVGAPSAVSGLSFDVTEAGVQSLSYLWFDGIDDFMVTPTITPGIDKAQVFAGVRPLSTTANQTIYATDPLNSVAGSFGLRVNTATALQTLLYGTTLSNREPTIPSVPVTLVTTQLLDIGAATGSENGLRVNGAAAVFATNAAGTGNLSAQPLYIGRYLGTSGAANIQIYSLIVRFGTNLDAGTITSTETWVNGKTGAY